MKCWGPVAIPMGVCRGKLIRFRDADGREHLRHMTDAALQGEQAALCAILAGDGLSINRMHQRDLAEYLSSVVIPTRVTHVERTGWHKIGDGLDLVLPGGTITASDLDERVVLNGAAQGPYEVRGTLRDWQAGVGAV